MCYLNNQDEKSSASESQCDGILKMQIHSPIAIFVGLINNYDKFFDTTSLQIWIAEPEAILNSLS